MMQSGVVPYEYAFGGGRFIAHPIEIGYSGILLEQAQFAITAEIRRWNSNSHFLLPFNVYTNLEITPSGRYEPKSSGTTLDNLLNPGASIFIDNILECRLALSYLFQLYAGDSDISDFLEYRRAWLKAAYPNNPSGDAYGFDDQVFSVGVGHWSRRSPSETGAILYNSHEVLGSSGVLFDNDVGEIIFNPSPHMSRFAQDNSHGRLTTGANAPFNIMTRPVFPAFQKTNGGIIGLTGREPVDLPNAQVYNTRHIASGVIRLRGYMLQENTSFALSREIIFPDSNDFTYVMGGTRAPTVRNLPDTVAFLLPHAQSSGVYRIGARNKLQDFPNTTIESGAFSQWPRIDQYWPSNNFTTLSSTNLGYHVFNDCVWMTDQSTTSAGIPSGLAILSPFTGHRLWTRYADLSPITVSTSSSATRDLNWSTAVGLERIASNSIYRLMRSIQKPTITTSGQAVFGVYNDMLDLTSTVASTSTANNEMPLGGNISQFHDFWFDGTYYWVTNETDLGVDMWQLDASFNYVTKYIFNLPSGINQIRGAFLNSTNVLFHGRLDSSSANFANSGIFPINIITPGTDPFDNTANIPEVGQAEISFSNAKYINAAPFLGNQINAEIMDIFEVSTATHVTPGIYAMVRFTSSIFSAGTLYLLRIEETTTAWEVRSIISMEAALANMPRRELLYMSY